LLTRSTDVAKPDQPAPATDNSTPATDSATPATQSTPALKAAPATMPNLEININGKTLPLQLGNPLEIVVGKERVRIVVVVPEP
jgi:hypothetical protein